MTAVSYLRPVKKGSGADAEGDLTKKNIAPMVSDSVRSSTASEALKIFAPDSATSPWLELWRSRCAQLPD